MKKALITGITGQDGSYLAELLLAKGYEVTGVIRRSSSFNTERLDHIYQDPHVPDYRLRLLYGDLDDGSSLANLLKRHPARRDLQPGRAEPRARQLRRAGVHGIDGRASARLRLLEAMRELGCRLSLLPGVIERDVRRVAAAAEREHAASSRAARTPAPRSSPTTCARTTARPTGCSSPCGILFNHESPAPRHTFVTRKITRAAARIKHGLDKKLFLGNLDARRDWGFAGDYVEAMWLMLQQRHARRLRDRHRASRTRCASSWTSPSARSGSTGSSTSRSTRATSARPRSTTCAATPAKARAKLGWKPKVTFKRADRDDGARRRGRRPRLARGPRPEGVSWLTAR